MVSLQYLSRSSLHLLAGLPCRLFLSYGLQVVTREVHRSSLRRLICPAQDHFIFSYSVEAILGIFICLHKFDIHRNCGYRIHYLRAKKPSAYSLTKICLILMKCMLVKMMWYISHILEAKVHVLIVGSELLLQDSGVPYGTLNELTSMYLLPQVV